jgi:rubrerythrin
VYIFNDLGEIFMKKAINREKMAKKAMEKLGKKNAAKLSKTQERKDKRLLQRLRRQMRAERAQANEVYDGWLDRMREEAALMRRVEEDG